MYRQILVPNKNNHSIDLPVEFYGKTVEILAFEIDEKKNCNQPQTHFLDDIEFVPDFPSIEDIRKNAWPEKE